MKTIKKDILLRAYIVYILVFVFAASIIVKVVIIQVSDSRILLENSKNSPMELRNIEVNRGNIFADDGSTLLSTSLPKFEIGIDPCAAKETIFLQNIDSLSQCLASFYRTKGIYPGRTAETIKRKLTEARSKKKRWFLIIRNAEYTDKKLLKTFPLLNLHRFRGGFLAQQEDIREIPFGLLARRTIGYSKKGLKPVGLDGAYNQYLQGISGKRLMKKTKHSGWRPVTNEYHVEPQNGHDIITTININIQDVAENALKTQLEALDADFGCAILMEVQTGHIKAIANLRKSGSGNYYEGYNYSVGESIEPGSTFKLASAIIALEDGIIDTGDIVDAGNGEYKYYGIPMKDDHDGGFGQITFKKAIEVSSNIAVSKVIFDGYQNNPEKYTNGLFAMNLNQKLGLEIYGEGIPQIKTPKDSLWSGISLPWMSIGYGVSLTPLQILTFYNAIANKGKMIQPVFVKEVEHTGRTIETFEARVINPSICSEKTLKKIHSMLEGVVKNGTGKNLRNTIYQIAGKTGTVQIANDNQGYSRNKHRGSFAGYFPADDPKYSCFVLISNPNSPKRHGSEVAAPVFKEISDKVFATQLHIHEPINTKKAEKYKPEIGAGKYEEVSYLCKKLNIISTEEKLEYDWVKISIGDNKTNIKELSINYNQVPDVRGLGLKDALFLLENAGMKVNVKGHGIVKKQSVRYGTKIFKGIRREITIELS